MIRADFRWRRYGRVGAHIAVACIKVGLFWNRWPADQKRRETARWSHAALDIFGFRLVITGERRSSHSVAPMLIANHTSWLDIFAIMAETDATFLAKQELRSWPVIGWLAARLGAVFLKRGHRPSLRESVQRVAALLTASQTIVVFPEGTTTDGSCVLPFHAALFDAALRSRASIQPVAIRYRRADGSPATEAAFVGDMSLIQSFQRLAGCRNCVVEIAFLPPIDVGGHTRQELARAAEHAIRQHLQSSRPSDRTVDPDDSMPKLLAAE